MCKQCDVHVKLFYLKLKFDYPTFIVHTVHGIC